MRVLFIVVALSAFVFTVHPTAGQYYCNGRAAITQQWGGCNGTEAVCSDLMAAITQTWNWWATVNNTNGNSLGVAVHNFFTTDAYGQLLSITNNNTAYPSICTKIAKIVAQLLTWNATKDANVLLGNATYSGTARQGLLGTVVPGWGYTIGQYIACGPTCTNYSSTTSTTTTSTTTANPTTTSVETTTSAEIITPCSCSVSEISGLYGANQVVGLSDNNCTININCTFSTPGFTDVTLKYTLSNARFANSCFQETSVPGAIADTITCNDGEWMSAICDGKGFTFKVDAVSCIACCIPL